jgi:hypothetical protein
MVRSFGFSKTPVRILQGQLAMGEQYIFNSKAAGLQCDFSQRLSLPVCKKVMEGVTIRVRVEYAE